MTVGDLFVAAKMGHCASYYGYYGGLAFFGFTFFFIMLLVKVGFDGSRR